MAQRILLSFCLQDGAPGIFYPRVQSGESSARSARSAQSPSSNGANMAATATINSQQTDAEAVVNRWLVDYYLFLALESFKNDKYSDFCDIRDVLESVLVRPVASTDIMPTKIFILQLLSRINDGERLDLSFEADRAISPLESALALLQKISQNCNIPARDLEKLSTSLKEMIVTVFIKNEKYDKAKEVLSKHFPKPAIGKKAIFMGLISQKSKRHNIIENIDFQQFKAEVLAFCQKLCPLSVPFLHKAAQQLIDRLGEREEEDHAPCEQEVVNITPVERHYFIDRYRLEASHKALATGRDARTFTELEGEVSQEKMNRGDLCLRLSVSPERLSSRDSQTNVFQRNSGSPIEASTADQRPQMSHIPPKRRKNPFTLARLVMEPDSQLTSQCTPSHDSPTEVPPQSGAASQAHNPPSSDTDSEVVTPYKKRPRQATKTSRRAPWVPVVASDSEEEPSRYMSNSRKSPVSQQSSSDSEDASCKPPQRRSRKRTANKLRDRDRGSPGALINTDSTLDSSPNISPRRRAPHRSPNHDQRPSHSKWKELVANAKESKDVWSDEDSIFSKKKGSLNESTSSSRRKKWTDVETSKLIEGVKAFGEGNWNKIRSYYNFRNRTNVNLKDRWRTLKKQNM